MIRAQSGLCLIGHENLFEGSLQRLTLTPLRVDLATKSRTMAA